MGQPLGKPGKQAALASTIVFIPFVLIFCFFAIYFYRDFAKNKLSKSTKQIKELETLIVRLEQNDTICPDMTCNSNNSNCNHNDINNNRKKYNNSRHQQQHNMKRKDHPGLFLKNICTRYKTGIVAGSNDHLLKNENIRMQSASVDQIDKDGAFKNDLKNEFKLDELYRSKVYRNTSGGQDCVRFSLDNVSFNTYNSNFSIQNTIQNSLQDCVARPFAISKKLTSKPFNSTKSIDNSGGSSTINDDQQSNDSNKMVKKENSFNNLSATIV